MVIMASGIARRRVRTMTTESCNMDERTRYIRGFYIQLLANYDDCGTAVAAFENNY